jgi:hypothetical protein
MQTMSRPNRQYWGTLALGAGIGVVCLIGFVIGGKPLDVGRGHRDDSLARAGHRLRDRTQRQHFGSPEARHLDRPRAHQGFSQLRDPIPAR